MAKKTSEPYLFGTETIIQTVTEGILGLDAQGKHTFVNNNASAILGFSPEELIGTDSHLAWHSKRPDDSPYPAKECPLHIALKEGTPTEGREHFVRKDGTIIPVEYACRPILEDGHPIGAVVSFIDITNRLERERELRILRTALQQSPVTAVITDLGGTIEYVNPQFERSTGYTATEAIGQNPRILKSGELPREKYVELWRTITSGENWRGTFHNKKKNGELYWEEAIISPVTDSDGRITHFLALKQDVTRQRVAEAEKSFQLHFQEVIAEISSRFAQVVPGSCGVAIDDALSRLGQVFGLGRTVLLRFSEDHRYVDCTNEWCAPGVPSIKETFTHYPISDMPWATEMVARGETVHIPDVTALPPSARAEAQQWLDRGVYACLCIPLKSSDGILKGFVGFDAIGQPFSWNNDQIRMLTVVVETIAGALDRTDTTEKLQQSESQLRTILESMTDVVWSLSYPELQPLFLSPSVEQLYGYPLEAFEKDPQLWLQVLHPDDEHTTEEVMEQLHRTGTGERECRIIGPDGNVTWISDRSHLIYNDEGEPFRIDGIATDISERKGNEEKIRYQNAFQEMISDVATRFVGARSTNIDALIREALQRIGDFFVIDRCSVVRISQDLTTATISQEWYRDPQRKITESPVHDFPIEKTRWFKEEIIDRRSPVHIPDTYEIPEKGAVERSLLLSLGIKSALTVPIYTERTVFGFMGIYTIDSYMEWTESQIRGVMVIAQILAHAFASIDAETQLIIMKEESIAAKEAAETANRAKSDFLSSMSHELRTPLNSVLGFTQILQSDPSVTHEHKELIDEIYRAGNHLLELVNEVLDLARIESGRIELNLESLCCREVLQETLSIVQPLAQNYNVTIDPLDIPDCNVFVDRTRLRQVMINLLSNAIKYNHNGGRTWITVTPEETTIAIAVSDTGTGIPADQMSELFTQFSRLGRERGDIDGTGIGLALTKRLVELMDGSIWVQSTLGKGSTFTVEFPSAPNQSGSMRTVQRD